MTHTQQVAAVSTYLSLTSTHHKDTLVGYTLHGPFLSVGYDNVQTNQSCFSRIMSCSGQE